MSNALHAPRVRMGLELWTGSVAAAMVPTGLACAGAGQLVGPLATLGLTGLGAGLHWMLALVAPLTVAVVWLGFRRHGQFLVLVLAGLGLLVLGLHAATHFTPTPDAVLASVGVGLLTGAAALDWRLLRRARQTARAPDRAAGS